MSVLIIAPHPDDDVIGCGGVIRSHIQKGERVAVVFLTSGELALKHLPGEQARKIREREAATADKILGLAEPLFLRQPDWMLADDSANAARMLQPVLEVNRPNAIYLPHPGDGHPDHQATLNILHAALHSCPHLHPELLGYEIWTPLAAYDVVVDITKWMPRKLRALRAHQSQLKEFDYVKAVRGLNQFRGALAGKCRYAEVFQTLTLPA